MHESIGGGQIRAPTSVTNGSSKSSSSNNSNNNGHHVDSMPIEHTSFGGSAQDNNTVKSRAEQMAAHRRVRIKSPLFFHQRKNFKLCGHSALLSFFRSCARLSWLPHSSVVVRVQSRTTSTSWSRLVVQRYVYVVVREAPRACSLQNPEF